MKANTEGTSACTAQAEPELRITITRDCMATFEGTAAQLKAEGLIPANFEWPRAAKEKDWQANGFDYLLRRSRPEGHKGPMRTWLELDNWIVYITVTGRDHHWRIRQGLKRQAEQLAAAHHRHTAAGSREWKADWRRYWKAHDDKAFQAFKNLIPGLIPPKRGRQPRQPAA